MRNFKTFTWVHVSFFILLGYLHMFWSKAAYLKNMHSKGRYPQYSIMCF